VASFLRIDPLGVFNFYLTLIDTSDVIGTLFTVALNYKVAGFSECTGLDATVEVFEFKEGGVNDHLWKFPTRASHGNITLKHGVIYLYDDLWTWHYDFVQGRGKRKDGVIVLMDEAKRPAKVWKFTKGVPMKWVGPALNAMQSNAAIESLEIAHEGLVLEVGA
jgi:phage tail-like protein